MATQFKQLSLVAAVSALVAVSSVMAVNNTPQAEPAEPAVTAAATTEVTQLSPEQVRMQNAGVIAAAGRSAMQHINAARKTLSEGDTSKTRELLDISSRILAQIDTVRADDSDNAKADRPVPIYARLGIVEGTELTPEMKQGLNDVAPLVATGQHQQVVERLRTFGIGLSYSYVELRPDLVAGKVADALRALDADDRAAAEVALAAADESLLLETVNVGLEVLDQAAAVDKNAGENNDG